MRFRSLHHRLIAHVATLVATALTLLVLLAGWELNRELEIERRASLERVAYNELARLEERIQNLLENTHTLTANHFIINGLLDPQGRRTYLPRLVKDFAQGRQMLAFSLVDFDGTIMHSEGSPSNEPTRNLPLRRALELGRSIPFFIGNEQRLAIAAPVNHYNTTQGAVLVEFDFLDILLRQFQSRQHPEHHLRIIVHDQEFISLTHGEGSSISARALADPASTPLLAELAVTLEISTPLAQHREPIQRALQELARMGAALLLIALGVIIGLGNNMVAPILTLYDRVRRSDSRQDIPCAPLGTHDELEQLAEAFDQRTLELRQHRDRLEERVAERTAALRQTEDMLRLVINAIPARVYWKDTQCRYLGCNRLFAQDAGFSDCDGIIGLQDDDMLWSHPGMGLPENDRVVLGDGKPRLHVQEPRTTPDGRTRWLRTSRIPLLNRDGKPLGILGLYEDITEALRKETDLRTLSTALEQSPLAVIITDTRGRITYVNQRFCSLTGYGKGDVMGKNPSLLKSGQTPPDTYRQLWQSLTSGEAWCGTLYNRRKDGSLLRETAHMAPIVDAQGQTTHYLAMKWDSSACPEGHAPVPQ
ncbi:MAG: PAS domain S-box protein [Magnetococcus sp. WYHC-3]